MCGSSAVPASQVRWASAHPQSSYYNHEICAQQFFLIGWWKFPGLYETRRLITVLPLSWARRIQSMPSLPISLRTISISSLYIHIFEAVSFIHVSLSKPCMHFSSPIRATCPANLVPFDLISLIQFHEKHSWRNCLLYIGYWVFPICRGADHPPHLAPSLRMGWNSNVASLLCLHGHVMGWPLPL